MGPNDSELVIKFRALYAKLIDWTDDDPEGVPSLADDDEILRRLCSDLGIAAFLLTCEERRNRRLFANPVDPKFVETWRDYEARYASSIACIQIAEIFDCNAASLDQPTQKNAETDFKHAADEANESATAIYSVFAFAGRNVRSEQEWSDDKTYGDYLEEIERGIAEWKLFERSGFDVKEVIRRRNLIPFVLIPRHVSAKYGESDKLSLLTLLQQAQEAFVFGIPLAAISLMRGILEIVLKRHYGAIGSDLSECINRARRLPRALRRDDLHGLRDLANSILHSYKETLGKLDPLADLDRVIVRYLFTLRLLIEFAPPPTTAAVRRFPNPQSR